MSAGSDASNGGYGNIPPNSNINGSYVNTTNSNYAGGFGSNEIPGTLGLPGLSGAKWNVDAAASYVPGICMKGGAKHLKRKIKNISRKYKMKSGKSSKKRVTSLKKRIKGRFARSHAAAAIGGRKYSSARRAVAATIGGKRRHGKTHRRRQHGGYAQYQNNLPMTPTYSVGGILSAANLGLANPPPIQVLPNCTNCVDNYNHFTNMGFPSRGH